MSEENKRLVGEITAVVWNSRGLDRIPKFYAPDFMADYRPYAPLREGHEGIRGMVEHAWIAFSDYHEELHELIAEGDRVVAHITISGTQTGQWGPLPPTGRHVQFDEIVILEIRTGDCEWRGPCLYGPWHERSTHCCDRSLRHTPLD